MKTFGKFFLFSVKNERRKLFSVFKGKANLFLLLFVISFIQKDKYIRFKKPFFLLLSNNKNTIKCIVNTTDK